MKTYIILFKSTDQKGLIAQISTAVWETGGNIIDADEHSTGPDEGGGFFFRLKIALEEPQYVPLKNRIAKIAEPVDGHWSLRDIAEPIRAAILVSKEDHCLQELLYLVHHQDLPLRITKVITNHDCHQSLVAQYKCDYHPLTTSDKPKMEAEILAEVGDVDLIILARYMQILSADFLSRFGKDIINIHHSFLPSFKGANPYRQAYDYGVKLIGATAHFVTEELDAGPIINQGVATISHADSVADLKRKGRLLEEQTLAKAILDYARHAIIRTGNKTIVFSK